MPFLPAATLDLNQLNARLPGGRLALLLAAFDGQLVELSLMEQESREGVVGTLHCTSRSWGIDLTVKTANGSPTLTLTSGVELAGDPALTFR